VGTSERCDGGARLHRRECQVTAQFLPAAPAPGEIVRVRQRQYLVEDVQPPPEPGEATLVSMSCLDDDAQGEALEVLWEHEIDTESLVVRTVDLAAAAFFAEVS